MPQSVARVAIHIVFSTKDRRPWLQDRTICSELYAYMSAVMKNQVDSPSIQINGVEDHVHVLCLLSRKFAMMDVVREAKTETSKWLKRRAESLSNFAWQGGYGAFSVSESNVEDVRRYILDQEEHHKRKTFQDEFRALCRRHQIDLDERYAWD